MASHTTITIVSGASASILAKYVLYSLLIAFIGPILWGHSGPLCHSLSLSLWTSILHCCSWLRLILVVVSTVATPGEWQCKIPIVC